MALCRACGKQSYVSRQAAMRAAQKIHERRGDTLIPYNHKGVWHLSSLGAEWRLIRLSREWQQARTRERALALAGAEEE